MFGKNKRDSYYFDSFVAQCQFSRELATQTGELLRNFRYEEVKYCIPLMENNQLPPMLVTLFQKVIVILLLKFQGFRKRIKLKYSWNIQVQ